MLTFPPVIRAPCPRGWLDEAKVAGAIKAAHGILSYAARLLACSRQTVMNYVRDHPICRQAQMDAREDMKDFAETRLFEAIDFREGWAVCFYLKCQAKDRGYVQSYQLSPGDGSPRIEFRFCVAQPPAFSAEGGPPTIDAVPVRAEAETVPPSGEARDSDSTAGGAAE